MIAVDTNILVHAHRAESPDHELALDALNALSTSGRTWAIPWPCAHEFIAVVTQPIFKPSTPAATAIDALEAWKSGGTLEFIGESINHFDILRAQVVRTHIMGSKVHDARIVAICVAHGINEFWSADRDFSRFPQLKVVNPLVV